MLRIGLALLTLLSLGGCAAIPWLGGGEEDPRPPTELSDISPSLGVRVLWSKEIGEGTDGRQLNLVPALQGQRLFIADAEGLVTALNAGDGRVIWQRETELPFSGGPYASEDRLILGSRDGDLIALSPVDGREIWRTKVGSEILSVPLVSGDTVVLHGLDDSIYGFAAADGEALWEYSYQAPVLTLRGSSNPVAAGDYAIVGMSGGRLIKIGIQDGLPAWEATVTPPRGRSELERIADLDATPVVIENNIFVCTYNGDLAAVDLTSGAVLWRRELSAYAGMAAADGMLYITAANDEVWAAQPQDGAGVWKQEALRYRRLSAPAVVGNYLVVGDLEGYLHWLARDDGRFAAREEVADGPIMARPLVSGNRIFVYGSDGTIAAITSGGAPPAGGRF